MKYAEAKKLNLEGDGAEAFNAYLSLAGRNKAYTRANEMLFLPPKTKVTKTKSGYDMNGIIANVYDDFKNMLAKDTRSEIEVRLHSPGGDALEGLAMFNLIRMEPRKFRMVNMGIAASAASYIFAAGCERHMGGGSLIMVHEAWGAAVGDAKQMDAMARSLDTISDSIAGIYAMVAKGDVSAWREKMKAETWMKPSDAVESGFATSAMGDDDDPEEDDDDEGDDDDDPPDSDDPESDDPESSRHSMILPFGNTFGRVVV